MIGIDKLMGEGRRALIAHQYRNEPLASPYNRGTKRHYYWSRGVVLARAKVAELNEIGS